MTDWGLKPIKLFVINKAQKTYIMKKAEHLISRYFAKRIMQYGIMPF